MHSVGWKRRNFDLTPTKKQRVSRQSKKADKADSPTYANGNLILMRAAASYIFWSTKYLLKNIKRRYIVF